MGSDALFDQLDAPDAVKWDPSEGDVLVGTVRSLGTFTGEYGTSRTVTVEPETPASTEDGQPLSGELVLFYASATVAANELDAADPRVGDRIGVKYHGEQQGKSGNSYHRYKIAVERRDQLVEKVSSDESSNASGGW